MRILSYNIHGCIGRDGREAPDRILKVIQNIDADVVGLQEVHSDDALDRDFLGKLEHLPYQSIIYGKTMRKSAADYGNLLLLREAPQEVNRIELPNDRGEPRGAIIAETLQDGQPLRIIATHLDIRIRERKRQIQTLKQHVLLHHHCPNSILLGDLNEWLPWRTYYRRFSMQFNAFSRLKTFPISPALFALDRIALRGRISHCYFRTDSSKLAQIASDHRPLIGDVKWRS
ncbi:endonuclease/exonuclease/phosphatase family protein [Coraliomargarita sp. SDUM461004]|uniref:Endonuclease/exonuclease/phosphatase family protein n=1 Tax=Thalassobacterium sedimentorum TaxID=3041258 RepID=A0ABU1AK75_9BACT|nr:endonuclease/exonuclease/phosphatase family protein [Coraliomargarita sp. SDUM461004]MDQ8195221.1 endonuclease/exonuclease/phosphatase family protein [Coraliomargarita sp. SDUM461004]